MAVSILKVGSGDRGHWMWKRESSGSEPLRTDTQGCSIGMVNVSQSGPLKFVSSSHRFSSSRVNNFGIRRRLGVIVEAQQGGMNYEGEEVRWTREEQRWLREEQRWQREEIRWSATNQALQEEVADLKTQVGELRAQLRQQEDRITDASLKSLVSGMRTLLEALGTPGAVDSDRLDNLEDNTHIPAYLDGESEREFSPLILVTSADNNPAAVTPEIDVFLSSSTSNPQSHRAPLSRQAVNGTNVSKPTTKGRRTLMVGVEGNEVKVLQDALANLGFHSGEEDMEDSVFSSGTSKAVKSWQSTIGVSVDGKVTPELMSLLVGEKGAEISQVDNEKKSRMAHLNAKSSTEQNEQHTASGHGTKEMEKNERSDAPRTEWSSTRVYLLGENRWEEPDRLSKKLKEEMKNTNGASTGMKAAVERCFACRGDGRTQCTECEGTGDLNVEEQFLEWVEEGAKCAYCEGLGTVQCDICYGKG